MNVDQSLIPFAVTTNRTYEHIEGGEQQHNHKVWISQRGSGLDKRYCTLQVYFRRTGGPTQEYLLNGWRKLYKRLS